MKPHADAQPRIVYILQSDFANSLLESHSSPVFVVVGLFGFGRIDIMLEMGFCRFSFVPDLEENASNMN